MNTKIISAFSKSGKTYACEVLNKRGYTVLDDNHTDFSLLRKNEAIKSNPEYPQNYINYIKENIGKADYIFVTSDKIVTDVLSKNEILFTLVYPNINLKAEWIGRHFLDGTYPIICRLIAERWDNTIYELSRTVNCDHIVLYDYRSPRCKYLLDLFENDMI